MKIIKKDNIRYMMIDFSEFLSPDEQKFFDCLSKVNENSIWGKSIHNVISNPEPVLFRRLVCELKEQCAEEPRTMQKILTEECFKLLLTL